LAKSVNCVLANPAKETQFWVTEGLGPSHPLHLEESIDVYLGTPFMASSADGTESVIQLEAFMLITPAWML
jgi:hypothetical protein